MAKVLFVQISSFELNSFQILSAVLKKHGHETAVFSLALEEYSQLNKFVTTWKPDIIGFIVTSFDYLDVLALSHEMKNNLSGNFHFVFGGPHAIISPMDLIVHPQVDSVCVGEGEYVLLELADLFDSEQRINEIQGLWTKDGEKIRKNPPRPFIEDLGSLPLDDKELYYKKYPLLSKAPFKVFTVSRGCPYHCTYCSNNYLQELIEGKSLRFRPPKQIIEEILNIKKNYPLEFIMFRSDTFTANKQWCIELMEEYKKKVKLPFYAQFVLKEVSEKLISLFAEAGLRNVIFAIESGNERIRREILRRPPIKNTEILEFSKILRKHAINITTQEMFAIPTEKLEDAFKTVELNIKMKSRMTSTILQPYLNTEITKYYDMNKIRKNVVNHFTGESCLDGNEVKRIVILQRISGWISRLPWSVYKILKPIIRLVTYIPDNQFFRLLSNMNYFFVQRRLINYTGSILFFIKFAYYANKSFNYKLYIENDKKERNVIK